MYLEKVIQKSLRETILVDRLAWLTIGTPITLGRIVDSCLFIAWWWI